jgi:hypothetical protein
MAGEPDGPKLRGHRIAPDEGLRAAPTDDRRKRNRPGGPPAGAAAATGRDRRGDGTHPGGTALPAGRHGPEGSLPGVRPHRPGTAGGLPGGGAEFPGSGPTGAGEDRPLAGRQGGPAGPGHGGAGRHRRLGPGAQLPGLLGPAHVLPTPGGVLGAAGSGAGSSPDPGDPPGGTAAAGPLRLAGGGRAHPKDGGSPLAAAPALSGRPGREGAGRAATPSGPTGPDRRVSGFLGPGLAALGLGDRPPGGGAPGAGDRLGPAEIPAEEAGPPGGGTGADRDGSGGEGTGRDGRPPESRSESREREGFWTRRRRSLPHRERRRTDRSSPSWSASGRRSPTPDP